LADIEARKKSGVNSCTQKIEILEFALTDACTDRSCVAVITWTQSSDF